MSWGYDLPSFYVEAIKKTPRLSARQQATLFKKYKNGDAEAGKKLVISMLGLLVHYAAKYGHNVDDLIQEAGMGAMHALKKYHPGRGTKFSTYAGFWIKA